MHLLFHRLIMHPVLHCTVCGVRVSCYIWSLLTFHCLTTEWLQWEMSSNMPVKD